MSCLCAACLVPAAAHGTVRCWARAPLECVLARQACGGLPLLIAPVHPWLPCDRRWKPSAAPRAARTAAAWATASPTAPSCGQTQRSRRASSRTGLAGAAAALARRCSSLAGAPVDDPPGPRACSVPLLPLRFAFSCLLTIVAPSVAPTASPSPVLIIGCAVRHHHTQWSMSIAQLARYKRAGR